MANVVVSNEVDNILNSIEHVPGPVPPNKYVDEAINNLNEQVSHNAEAAQEVNVELKVNNCYKTRRFLFLIGFV